MAYAINWNADFHTVILYDDSRIIRVTTPEGRYAWEVVGPNGDPTRRFSRALQWDADPAQAGGERTPEWTQAHQFPTAKAADDAYMIWFERDAIERKRAQPGRQGWPTYAR